MIKWLMGFLSVEGWAGVQSFYRMVAIGVTVGMFLLYHFLIYQKLDMPKRITVKKNLFKISLLLVLVYLLW